MGLSMPLWLGGQNFGYAPKISGLCKDQQACALFITMNLIKLMELGWHE